MKKKLTKRLLEIKIVFWACAPAIAMASTTALDPSTVPLAKWTYALILSAWGGLANLLQRWGSADEQGSLALFVTRAFVCSISAGVLTFFICLHYNVAPFLAAIAVFLGGYGGARFLDFLYAQFESRISTRNKA
jgi:hypothetical protein